MTKRWTYEAGEPGRSVEVGRLCSLESAPSDWHFHDEVQVVAVLTGRRVFRTARGVLCIDAGEVGVFPAGTPHAALAGAGCEAVSFYFPPDLPQARHILSPVKAPAGGAVSAAAVLETVAKMPCRETAEDGLNGLAQRMSEAVAGGQSIHAVARAFGYSSDGFSRAFRRLIGVGPRTYRIAHRLTLARDMLRHGGPLAEAACAAGFADQSHMGRLFLRAYGATPAVYRCGVANGRLRSRQPAG